MNVWTISIWKLQCRPYYPSFSGLAPNVFYFFIRFPPYLLAALQSQLSGWSQRCAIKAELGREEGGGYLGSQTMMMLCTEGGGPCILSAGGHLLHHPPMC